MSRGRLGEDGQLVGMVHEERLGEHRRHERRTRHSALAIRPHHVEVVEPDAAIDGVPGVVAERLQTPHVRPLDEAGEGDGLRRPRTFVVGPGLRAADADAPVGVVHQRHEDIAARQVGHIIPRCELVSGVDLAISGDVRRRLVERPVVAAGHDHTDPRCFQHLLQSERRVEHHVLFLDAVVHGTGIAPAVTGVEHDGHCTGRLRIRCVGRFRHPHEHDLARPVCACGTDPEAIWPIGHHAPAGVPTVPRPARHPGRPLERVGEALDEAIAIEGDDRHGHGDRCAEADV